MPNQVRHDSLKNNEIKKEFIVILIITLLAGLFLGKTLFPSNNQIIYGGDLLSQFYYWKGFLKDSIGKGVIPFWNPYNFSGTPFLPHPGIAAFYPLTLVFLLLPLNLAFSWTIYFHLLIAGTGMYLLSRRYADKLISLISALIFMFSGYFAARIYAGHIDLLT